MSLTIKQFIYKYGEILEKIYDRYIYPYYPWITFNSFCDFIYQESRF